MPLVCRSRSRALGTGLFVVVFTALAVLLTPLARAQAEDQSATTLQGEADALASRYFSALDRVHSLDADIARNQKLVDNLTARAKKALADARSRALIAYTTAGSQLSDLVDGNNSLDTARRAHLIDSVNAHDQSSYSKLRAATRALHKQQRLLRQTRQSQSDALNQLRDEGAVINAKLEQAAEQERAAQTVAATASAPSAAAGSEAGSDPGAAPAAEPTTTTGPAAATPSSTTDPSTTTTTAPPAAPTPPPDYTGTPGTNPHHDDPFLTCVRQRESSGNYSAVNAAGPYLGAYQFLEATWNLAASHAGHADFVGVPANQATPYDQDEIAWTLYQWQGKGPWGGSC